MIHFWSNNYLPGKPIEDAMQLFAHKFKDTDIVLDIGCGKMPYRHFFTCKYIGVDPQNSVKPDIVANAWEIPLKNNSVDGIILNQSLEHIAETNKTIKEIKRVLRPGGKGIVTVPQTMKNHSSILKAEEAPVTNFNKAKEPYWRVDYYRFTKFGLIYIFRDFSIDSIDATTGFIGTITQLCNYFAASFQIPYVFIPFYVLMNILGKASDGIVLLLLKLKIPGIEKFYHYVYSTLTVNYILSFHKYESTT